MLLQITRLAPITMNRYAIFLFVLASLIAVEGGVLRRPPSLDRWNNNYPLQMDFWKFPRNKDFHRPGFCLTVLLMHQLRNKSRLLPPIVLPQ